MEKDKQQSPKAKASGDPWSSAFDPVAPAQVQPPPAPQLTATSCTEAGEPGEEEYAPETVVFEIGGFADPENPAAGGGKGIKVVIPPDLDGPTALVHVMMGMLRITESEAKTMIVRERMQWVDYQQDGQYLDRQGNAVHMLRFKPKYAERIAHEPETLRPTEGEALDRYMRFKQWLAQQESGDSNDPYAQYDAWAEGEGLYIAEPTPGGDVALHGNMVAERRNYEHDREAVVNYVVWERLRAKREGLAVGIATETTTAKSLVEGMADSLPSLVDMAALQYHMPEKYYAAWTRLHGDMILAQGAVEKGDATALQANELPERAYQLAYWFAKFAAERLGKVGADGGRTFAGFNAADVNAILLYGKQAQPTLEQGREFLYRYYKLTFALMEVAGRLLAYGNTATLLQPHSDDALAADGRNMSQQGRRGVAMLDLVHAHSTARKVNAVFYPDAATLEFDAASKDSGKEDGLPIELMLWHDAESGEWVLEDFTDIGDRKENRVEGKPDAPVPAELFAELNSKLRFPKGALYYRCPDEASYRILRTTEPTEWSDWLRWAAMAGLAAGLVLTGAGAGVVAQVLLVSSAAAMAGGEAMAMAEEAEQGMLGTDEVVVHGAMLASCVLGGTSGALRIAGLGAGKVALVVSGLQVGADGVCVAVFTQEAFAGLSAAAREPEGATMERLTAFFLQLGMNGLMLYGMRGAAAEAAGITAAKGKAKAKPRVKDGGKGQPHGEFAAEPHLGTNVLLEESTVGVRSLRERMAELGGWNLRWGIQMSDAEIGALVAHAKGLGFGTDVVEALLAVHMRMGNAWAPVSTMNEVASRLKVLQAKPVAEFKEGWDVVRAYVESQRRIMAGGKLDAVEYLAPSYVESHLGKFQGECSYLLPTKAYDDFVVYYDPIGRVDGQYVSTVMEIDRILKKAKGNISVIESELAIPQGSWHKKGGITRINISKPETLNLRIPDGSETGANAYWIPGGSTFGGVEEAVTNQIPKAQVEVINVPTIE